MARRFATSIDLLGFSLLNAMLHPVSSDPAGLTSGDKGRVWFNTVGNVFKVWNGTAAIDLLDRANHTGSQLASTISDFNTAVRLNRLDQMATPTADVAMGSHKITGLLDGTSAQDAISKNQLDTALASLASGQTLKGAVKAAATTNVSISAAPSTIDGVTGAPGDIFLLTGQTTGAQNGPYVYGTAGAALTRATNWDTTGEAVLGSYWIVQQGTNADTFALLTNDTAITLGTTTPTFVFRGASGGTYTAGGGIGLSGSDFSVAAGTGLTQDTDGLSIDVTKVLRKLVQGGTVIPTATSGAFTVTGTTVVYNHALNTNTPDVQVMAHTTPASGYTADTEVVVDWVATDANNVTISLPVLATNNWRLQVRG